MHANQIDPIQRMYKLYFLISGKNITETLIHELRTLGIKRRNISILASDEAGFDPKIDVSEIDLKKRSAIVDLYKSDFLPALEKGAAAGGAMGLIAGLAVLASPAGFIVGGGAVLLSTTLDFRLGPWISSVIGIPATHQDIEKFVQAIKEGQVLMMVEVDDSQVENIKFIIKRNHPEVVINVHKS